MELNLKGKTALITGGSRGIGLAIKKALEKEGVKCISISKEEGYDVMHQNFSVSVIRSLTDCDILINNVGGLGTLKNSNDIMFKNYNITEFMTRMFLLYKKKYGKVITISSIYGKEKGHNPEFTAAKAAQIAYMKSLAGTYPGITFNTICPGCINTKQSIVDYAKNNNMTLGSPEDVANIVTFLCSDLAKHINGATITVDGGDSHSF